VADIVIEPNPAGALPPVSVAAVLESALRARKSGNFGAARALLRALVTQQPDLAQVWLVLATVAETRAEQRNALEQVLALDPRNEPAQRGLAHMRAAETGVAALAAAPNGRPEAYNVPLPPGGSSSSAAPTIAQLPTTAPTPGLVAAPAAFTANEHAEATRTAPGLRTAEAAPAQAARDLRWPLYAVIGVSALVVLIAAILIRGSEFMAALQPAPTAALPALGAPTQAVAPALGVTLAPALAPTAMLDVGTATSIALVDVTTAPTAALIQPTAAPTTIASPLPTPRKSLAPGMVVEQGQWHVILIRPEDAVALEGSIGSFQPNGQFVLALLAIGNDGPMPARLPDDLFVLVDGSGKRYAPLPQISTAYLNAYGRGQHGDLSMEDPIPSDGGNKSVPLIFDVPPGARPLYLLVGDSAVGWSILP
jgi:hypothetical protein